MARRGWWRRRPLLPLPGEAYWHFRVETAYGGGDGTTGEGAALTPRTWSPSSAGVKGPVPAAGSLAAMERVLLLNATYEPLALVSDRRAVVLVLAGRAEAGGDARRLPGLPLGPAR